MPSVVLGSGDERVGRASDRVRDAELPGRAGAYLGEPVDDPLWTFTVRLDRTGHAVVIVRGELDRSTLPALVAVVQRELAGDPAVRVDMSAVTFADLAAVRLFSTGRFGSLPLIRPSRAVERAFRLVNRFDVGPGGGHA